VLKRWGSRMLLAIFLSTFAQTVFASSIVMGVVELRLGMKKEAVLSSLNKCYKLIPEDSDTFIILHNNDSKHNVVGSVGFNNGILFYVSKDWYYGRDIKGFYQVFFGLINRYSKENYKPIQIIAETFIHPGIETKMITLHIPDTDLYYKITEFNGNGDFSYSINECLFK
jgi:hypothetical protein